MHRKCNQTLHSGLEHNSVRKLKRRSRALTSLKMRLAAARDVKTLATIRVRNEPSDLT